MTHLLRWRAARDLERIRLRLAELEAAGPYDDKTTLFDVLGLRGGDEEDR